MAITSGTSFTRFTLRRGLSVAARAGRVMTYLCFATASVGFLGARVVYADMERATTRLGRTLERFGDLTPDPSTIVLNGASVHIATVFTEERLEAVLDRYEAECSGRPGVLGRAVRELVTTPAAAKAVPPGPLRVGVVRDGDEHGGMVACFAGDAELGLATDRIRAFLTTHDLAALGLMRYVAAEQAPDGRTRVRTIWTDGPLPLDAMFPAHADARGEDSALAPRPPASRRIVAAAAVGEPYAVRIYQSTGPAREVGAFYDREMAARGFARVQADDAADGAAYVREDGAMVIVAIGESDGKTSVSVVDGTRGASTAAATAAPAE